VVVPILLIELLMARMDIRANRDWAGMAQRMQADYRNQHDNPIAIYEYADALAHTSRVRDAVEYYRKALEKRPDSVQVRQSLAQSLYTISRYDAASREYRELAQRFPLNLELRLRLVHIAIIRNELDHAERYLNEAKLIAPNDARVRAAAHRLDMARKDFPELPTDQPRAPLPYRE